MNERWVARWPVLETKIVGQYARLFHDGVYVGVIETGRLHAWYEKEDQ